MSYLSLKSRISPSPPQQPDHQRSSWLTRRSSGSSGSPIWYI